MNRHNIYIVAIMLLFACMVVVFNTFPRSKYSLLEKRELALFPKFSWHSLRSGAFMAAVSSWYSDSEPFRDELMAVSMEVKHYMAVSTGEDNIAFHVTKDMPTDDSVMEKMKVQDADVGGSGKDLTVNENAKIANKGIIVVGQGSSVRAIMAYGGSSHGGGAYARAANEYKKAFGPSVNVYCMVIPTAAAFYCPERARRCTNDQRPTINHIHSLLDADVLPVDVYTALGNHAGEDIYLRTDHHWAPLGAFYAAEEFARVARVPFRQLNAYTRKVVRRYVGSMYGYSNDISIKNAPEDFVYYVPNAVRYTTIYTDYKINESYQVVGEGKPHRGTFFYKYHDGNGGAYCTFMGGDTRITKVLTGTSNHRRVLILKDSFGNALPGYLFYSFEEVHVVDYRYFTKNMRKYVADNGITDILFANNIFNAYSGRICNKYMRFLNQTNGTSARRVTAKANTVENDTATVRRTRSIPDAGNGISNGDSIKVGL